jgi:hypothetical protein
MTTHQITARELPILRPYHRAWLRSCPKCGAGVEQPCKTESGRTTQFYRMYEDNGLFYERINNMHADRFQPSDWGAA